MYIRQLQIENLRAFRRASIDLLYPGRAQEDAFADISRWPPRLPNVNVILGINGSGKSTILYGAALAFLAPIASSSGYRPYSLIRRSRRGATSHASVKAEVVLHAQDGTAERGRTEEFSADIERRRDLELLSAPPEMAKWDGLFEEDGGAFFLVGYGASRRTEAVSAGDLAQRRRARSVRFERVASLFEDHFALVPLSTWLPGFKEKNPGRHKQVETLLNKVLPPAVRFTGEIEAGEYLFRHRAITVPFGALSDGYKVYIGWIGDLLYHLCMGAPSGARLVESRGVVMVDEIDLHIHPAWQRTIIPALARTLKNIQFIFTTHSPLVVGTLERANVLNIETAGTGLPVISRPDEETFGLSADQILRSDVFGLESTRDPEFQKRLAQLSQAAMRGEPGAALLFNRSASVGGGDIPDAGDPPEWLKSFAAKS